MYGYGFLSRSLTDRREILHGGSATSQTGLLLFWGIAPGTAELWASTGAIWRDMLLAEAFSLAVCVCMQSFLVSKILRIFTKFITDTAYILHRKYLAFGEDRIQED